MSFNEKTLWLLLASLVAVFGAYFASVLPGHGLYVEPRHIGAFAGVVVLLVILQVGGAILLAAAGTLSGSMKALHDTDERDALIRLKGARNAGYVLSVGVFLALSLAVFAPGNFAFTHLLLGFWVLAQVVEVGSQLFHYRRGA